MTTEKLIITAGIEAEKITISLNLDDKSVTVRGINSYVLVDNRTVVPNKNDVEISTIRIKDITMQLENATAERKPALEAKLAAGETCINAIAAAVQSYLQTEFLINNPGE